MARLESLTLFLSLLAFVLAREPFLKQVDKTSWAIGNDIWNVTLGPVFGKKLWYQGHELVGKAAGHYVSYNPGTEKKLSFTRSPPRIFSKVGNYTDIIFSSDEGDLHWVLTPTLAGAYQYFVNRALPTLGEFRTLWRLDNNIFNRGSMREQSDNLPNIGEIQRAKKVYDETWLEGSNKYITKYSLAAFVGAEEGKEVYWGVYSRDNLPAPPKTNSNFHLDRMAVGSWYIHGGKEYFNGDHLKQELTFHTESSTGDAVQLNMIHGTHFQSISHDDFVAGRIWGPWLWYLNNQPYSKQSNTQIRPYERLVEDAHARANEETNSWPYSWMPNSHGYHTRGHVSGHIVLSDGRPASRASVFLGDNHPTLPTLDQGSGYYYRTETDDKGFFSIKNVRQGVYNMQAWPGNSAYNQSSPIGDISTVFSKDDIAITADKRTDLGQLKWKTSGKRMLWQIGDFDRTTHGFQYGGIARSASLNAVCKPNANYNIGQGQASNWCFRQENKPGVWRVNFQMPENATKTSATLTVSLAGFSGGISADVIINNLKIGQMSQKNLGKPDQGVYRLATLAGEWRMLRFQVPKGSLVPGHNVLDIRVPAGSNHKDKRDMADAMAELGDVRRGWLYDSILLEEN